MASCNCMGSLCGKCRCACACTCHQNENYWQLHSAEAFLHNAQVHDSILSIADLIEYKRESLEDILPELPKE